MNFLPKYNKKNNTYFIYEMLVRKYIDEYGSGVGKKDVILEMIKKRFRSNSVLGQERNLYEQIVYMPIEQLTEEEKLYVLRRCRDMYCMLEKKELQKQRSTVLSEANRIIGDLSFLEKKINDYKLYANIYHYFNENNVANLLVLEKMILKDLANVRQNFVNESFWQEDRKIEKEAFNSDAQVISYLIEHKNAGLSLFLYEKIAEYKKTLLEHSICSECEVCDVEMKSGILKIFHRLEELKKRELGGEDLEFIMSVSDLVEELKRGE